MHLATCLCFFIIQNVFEWFRTMNGTVVFVMVLSGLSFLPYCFPHVYHYIRMGFTWKDAQNYCRSKFTDLATIQNQKEQAKLNPLLESQPYVWIGLHADAEAWKWSLEKQDYYGAEQASFRMWASGEPNGLGKYQVCVIMTTTGEWADTLCTSILPFICYSATIGTQSTSSNFVFVSDKMTWTDAQSYCRNNYSDLASVRNQAENDQIRLLLTQSVWIGLYRDSWKWSDGSFKSFSYWYPGNPSTVTTPDACVSAYYSKWMNFDCTYKFWFLCFDAEVRRQVVQVVLKKTDSSVDMKELTEDILQKFIQALKNQKLDDYVRFTWLEPPDGNIFHKKNPDGSKEVDCPLK